MTKYNNIDWRTLSENVMVHCEVGCVYPSNIPGPEGPIPLYGTNEEWLGRILTLSEGKRDCVYSLV